jgi:N-acetylmuramoyl-L-alanine amidase
MLPGRLIFRLTGSSFLAVGFSAVSTIRPHPTFGQAPRLPPVPSVHGPLAIRVVYPTPAEVVSVDDSSFILGSIGDGGAALSINGRRIAVAPNGGFLAWVAYPPESPARFVLVARRGTDSVRAELVVRRSGFVPPDQKLWIDSTSLSPRGRLWWPAGEPVALEARASTGARLELVLPDRKRIRFATVPGGAPPSDATRAFERDPGKLAKPRRGDRYQGSLASKSLGARLPPILEGLALGRRPPPRRTPAKGRPSGLLLEAIRDRDTVRVRWPLDLVPLDATELAVELRDDPTRATDVDSLTAGRAHPGATYHWFFPTGTVARVTGRINDDLRLGLSRESSAWVPVADADPIPPARVAGLATVGSITMTPLADRTRIRIPVRRRVPYFVDETDRQLRLTLYGASADVNWIRYGTVDSTVLLANWRQRTTDEVDLTFTAADPLVGYRIRWEANDLLLDLRRAPAIDPSRPLAGRLIAIDPGHPPVGSTGPTGLTEAEANLRIATALVPMLEAAGARVILTRSSERPVELWRRVRLADSLEAEVLVSIHNNALPDGLDPWTNHGSTTFYFHPQSLGLARRIQRRVVDEFGLPDLGVARGDLALARPTWMPAVLVEGLFLMIPEEEATLRSAEGPARYARAVLRGLEDHFAAAARHP